jgi:pimeloyl-ACP methyl ester carboxylesterase
MSSKAMNFLELTRYDVFRSKEAKARFMAAYDVVLAKWPVAYESLYVPTSLGMTHVIASGPIDAPPLLLIPGLGATATVWRPNVQELSRHFRVLAVDVIGMPGKSVASRVSRSRRAHAEWITTLLDSLGIQRASMVGNSYGAFLAMNQALLAPDRVDRVVLINPGGLFVSVLPFLLSLFRHMVMNKLGLSKLPQPPDVRQYLGRNVPRLPEDDDWAALASLMFADRQNIFGPYPSVFSDVELQKICAPVLLLMGDNDPTYSDHPSEVLKLAQKRMPTLEAHMIVGAHHAAAVAKPAEVNAKIVEFLQRNSD